MNKKLRTSLKALSKKLGKRPRTVLDILLRDGEVSTYKLGQLGYDQPPRAAQDLKEHGVKLKTKFGKHPKSGARMGIYVLDEEQVVDGSYGGRVAFTKKFRSEVLEAYAHTCALCRTTFSSRYLQIDHRVPFLLASDKKEHSVKEFQLLCAPHQRAKSWECEHCPNLVAKDPKVCGSCYWAYPDDYSHVATKQHRLVSLSFSADKELAVYQRLIAVAKQQGTSVEEVVQRILSEHGPTDGSED